MPAYTFKCFSCGREFDLNYAVEERPDSVACADCGGTSRPVIRWSGSSVLRGQGWARHPERDSANRKRGPQ